MKDKILKLLKNHPEGLCISDVARLLKTTNRITASKYLAILEAEGKIKLREIGPVKLYYVK